MSENKDDSTENPEKEPDIIYVQYDANLIGENGNIVLEVIDDSQLEKTNLNEENSTENTEVDSPDFVNIEDYKSQDQDSVLNNCENNEDHETAVLCEASLETDLSNNSKGSETAKLYDLVWNDNIIEDIPNEVLVYTCQPKDESILNMFPCKCCGMVVGCIFCLKSHYESIHLNLGIIQYKCDQTSYLKNYTEICHKCNLVCESKDEMIEHRKIHFVSCDVCEMSFDSPLFLSNHCKSAHEKFEVIISCDLCEQWFKQLQELSDHYESYHEMIICIVCFKRFPTQNEMEEHHKTHKIVLKQVQNVLPYACSKCNQAFSEINELSAHLSKEHGKKKVSNHSFKTKTDSSSEQNIKARAKRTVIFDDCGGLSQEFYIVETKTKKIKKINQ